MNHTAARGAPNTRNAAAYAHPVRRVKTAVPFVLILVAVAAASLYSAVAVVLRVDQSVAPGFNVRLPSRFARLPGLDGEPVDGVGQNRINILVLGIDQRPHHDAAIDGPPRSDSMYVISLDPLQKTASVIAIPRDLYVEVPNPQNQTGYWDTRINTALHYGELYRYPGGGPALARRTVEHLIKQPISYFAVVDWVAFVQMIDALGGIDLAVPETLRGVEAFNVRDGNAFPITIRAGQQTMDSVTALAYARFRDDAAGDFGRVQRQQQVMTAALMKGLALGWLGRTAALYGQFRGAIVTDITPVRLPGLVLLLKQIGLPNVQMVTLAGADGENVARRITPDGEDVLIPNWGAFGATLRAALPDQRLTTEAATVKLVNATATRELATRTAEQLARYGVPRAALLAIDSPVGQRRESTSITLYTDAERTAQRLAEILELPQSVIQRATDPARLPGDPAIVVTLGADLRLPNDRRYDGFRPR